MPDSDRVGGGSDQLRTAENVLKKLGYARVPPARRDRDGEPSFWVQESGVPRRTFPVFVHHARSGTVDDGVDRWVAGVRTAPLPPHRAIFVVANDRAAEETWDRLSHAAGAAIENEVSVLVVPAGERADPTPPHFHLRVAAPAEILRLATGIVVGLFRRAQASEESGQIDFEELLGILRQRFGVDVNRSLGVRADEDALFLLYQLAQRDSYAPGEPGANLHLLVLKPTGPAARLPWFAA
ncbi:MAG: hypothetical protein L3J68_03705 [Thermoplasmata archaeon]|jgi:hypothetical protein|nr:hypothetical protein [Thermoplasmata archaeon]